MISVTNRPIRLFYFVTDSHPAWRVDLTELFSHELKKRGVQTAWSMRRENAGFWTRLLVNGEVIFLPAALPGIPGISPIIRRLGEFLGELLIFLSLVFGTRFDIIQVRDDRYTAAFFALLAARLRGSRFIYWVSFPFPENDQEKMHLARGAYRQFLRLRSQLTKWWLYKTILPKADHVFVQSERMKADIAAYGLPEERMTPVPMGVPTSLIDWSTFRNTTIKADCVVYLGTLARGRHLETLIEAFALVIKQVPQAKLYMVGSGDKPEDRAFLEQRCAELGISGNVVFTGFLDKEAAWRMAGAAAVCVSPIFNNQVLNCGSPTKLYEYMALARPVVANQHPEQTKALAASGAGLCVIWSAESFADAIVWMLRHPTEAERMGRQGPEWVIRNHRYDHIAAAVAEKYRVLLSQQKFGANT